MVVINTVALIFFIMQNTVWTTIFLGIGRQYFCDPQPRYLRDITQVLPKMDHMAPYFS